MIISFSFLFIPNNQIIGYYKQSRFVQPRKLNQISRKGVNFGLDRDVLLGNWKWTYFYTTFSQNFDPF